MRKPGFKVSFLDVEDRQKLHVRSNESAQLDLLRRTFADDPDIQKHIPRRPPGAPSSCP